MSGVRSGQGARVSAPTVLRLRGKFMAACPCGWHTQRGYSVVRIPEFLLAHHVQSEEHREASR